MVDQPSDRAAGQAGQTRTTVHSRDFLWGIADDVLRDLFKRGKYPDVVLPMCVLRRTLLLLKKKRLSNDGLVRFAEDCSAGSDHPGFPGRPQR